MDQDQVEKLLAQKYASGEADVGLYNAGLQFVFMDTTDGKVVFQWFDEMKNVGDFLYTGAPNP